MTTAARHIGIVGCSAAGAALCYRTICIEGTAYLGAPYAHPEVSMHTQPFSAYAAPLDARDWDGVADLMLDSAAKLARAGADFLICPDNTIHGAMSLVEPASPLPWLNMVSIVAAEAATRQYRRVGLLGTRWLIDSETYPEALRSRGVDFMRPSDEEREEGHRIIMQELVFENFNPQGITYHQSVIERMKDNGCDAVVLGCTELPLILNDSNSPLPTLDSTRLLAREALRAAVASKTLERA